MSEAFPEVITRAARREGAGTYRSTHRPRSAQDQMRLDVYGNIHVLINAAEHPRSRADGTAG